MGLSTSLTHKGFGYHCVEGWVWNYARLAVLADLEEGRLRIHVLPSNHIPGSSTFLLSSAWSMWVFLFLSGWLVGLGMLVPIFLLPVRTITGPGGPYQSGLARRMGPTLTRGTIRLVDRRSPSATRATCGSATIGGARCLDLELASFLCSSCL